MKFLPVKYQIALGLTAIVTTTVFLVVALGFGPDTRQAVMLGRKRLCESVAINSSILLTQSDLQRVKGLLEAMVDRDDDMLSAAIRRSDGQAYAEIGDHQTHWQEGSDYSTETQLQVPLWSGETKWGTVELCFRPISGRGLAAFLRNPWTRLVALVGVVTFALFCIYLTFTLRQLDPKKAIPKRVQFALDNLAEGLLVTDKRGRVLLANEAFANWAGKRSEQLIGVDASRFPWHHPHTKEPCGEFPWVLAIEREAAEPNFLLALTDCHQNELTLVAHASPLLGTDGNYRGVLTSFEDITTLEHHKAELAQARDAADEANRAKSEFLARMSHEIRTPMNAILGYTEVLRRGLVDNQRQREEHLATIQNSGEHLLALINDILDLSKIEAGKMDIELIRTSPFTVISQVISVLRIKAEEKGIMLKTHFPTRLPEMIFTDAVRLRQAMINLVGNAIKFTSQGEVRVTARMTSASRPLLAIEIADTGIGIAPDAMTKIFDPFCQADTSMTRRFGGTGLGLSISRQLARRLGGDLTVASQLGVGSVFTITIDPGPMDDMRFVDCSQLARSVESSPLSAPKTIAKLPPCRVLVVDDAEENRQLVTLFLKRAGAEVIEAANGKEAVELERAAPFDVILMDMHMPIMDGFSATRELRKLGCTTEIVALTADVMKDDERKCRQAGCTGFLTKPISMDRLLQTITQIVGGPITEDVDLAEIREQVRELGAEVRSVAGAVVPSVPMDDPDYRQIVGTFVSRLQEKLVLMKEAHERGDFDDLAELGHWLKGSGGTVGFQILSSHGEMLESRAKSRDAAAVKRSLDEIEDTNRRIDLGSTEELAVAGDD